MFIKLLNDPLCLMALCIVLGQILGSRQIRHFKLGSSATLFIGLLMSHFITSGWGIEVAVPKIIFSLSLIGFIASVGLTAARNIKSALKAYGVKFMVLGITVTLSGAVTTFVLTKLFTAIKYNVLGTYVGALTSSPGLATALEMSEALAVDQSAAVGLGYSIAYIPGVLIVIVFAQLMGKLHASRNRVPKIAEEHRKPEKAFRLTSFMLVVLLGIILGSFEIRIGQNSGFSLDMTGGVLLSALLLGSSKKTQAFDFDDRHLGIIRDISLNMFLAIVGLNYGYEAFYAIQESGIQLLLIGLATGIISIIAGYAVGKYILRIDPFYLVGGICGGMTSTPGLAAAIDAFDSEEVTAGYGATYPFALLLMIILTKLLFIY